jgi:hypothetical protein
MKKKRAGISTRSFFVEGLYRPLFLMPPPLSGAAAGLSGFGSVLGSLLGSDFG